MYKRYVIAALVFFALIMVGAGFVANNDPFDTGSPWMNWLTLSVGGFIGVFIALMTFIGSWESKGISDEGERWVVFCVSVVGTAFFGAMIVGIILDGASDTSAHLGWTTYGVSLILMNVAYLVMYLMPEPKSADALSLHRAA